FGVTFLSRSCMVQSSRAGANIVDTWRIVNAFLSYCDAGIKTYFGYAPAYTSCSISGGFGMSSNNVSDNKFHPHTYSVNDDGSVVHGTHQWSFGGGLTRGTYSSKADFVAAGTMTFNGQETGLGMGDFMLGRVSTLVMGTPNASLALKQT